MKPSLEDERRALLEQIEASRAVYRRMLAGEPHTAGAHAPRHSTGDAAGASPGKRALQWATEHPAWVAAGVALLVLLAPRVIGSGRRAAARRKSARRPPEPPASGGTLRALLTVAALLLRDPARLRAAAAFAGSAWRWIQQRRRAGPASLASPGATAARPGTRFP